MGLNRHIYTGQILGTPRATSRRTVRASKPGRSHIQVHIDRMWAMIAQEAEDHAYGVWR